MEQIENGIVEKSTVRRAQMSLFGNVTNRPSAEDWIQNHAANGTLNKDAGSSMEYDGDVFLPSGNYFASCDTK